MSTYLIINTGGTIGMVTGPKGLTPHPDAISQAFTTHSSLQDWQQHRLIWKHWSPLLDSSDLQPEHWFELKQTVENQPDVDGVLIIHGTDTLAYTATALSFLLTSLSIPVVITGSMHPISAPQTDAIDNLNNALATLNSGRAEVMVAVGQQPLPGSRVTKASTLENNAFAAPGWDLNLWPTVPKTHPVAFNPTWRTQDVRVYTLYPGFSLPTRQQLQTDRPDAILINAYGNGNAADTAANRASLQAMQDLDIPIFVRSQCHEGEVSFGQYAASALFAENGAVSCGRMSFEAALTKILLLCNESKDAQWIQQQFATPFAREWQND
ncbi:asparaginase [Reinekea blandensis]|uniref:L-asparaginase I n=1 Tax=Reinekea blandensis MED297 TaxID=314283 RepID=A4BBZ2_9GAMM|nr:asparaginase [Reinekea blandensis]EAR10477.1 L-asparaginase I [Reinekea sp. MED297] [Reinekea blandensis MED297]